MKKQRIFLVVAIFLVGIFIFPYKVLAADIWEVRSVDTMKTSRDLARQKLNDRSYDTSIQHELALIKELGANYVAIDTPYDKEFYPYLNRWVKLARKNGLHVWFRGNWSSWEGWFDYPKNMSPQEHLRKTAEFISINPELFEDGDAFDPCPECENAGFWKQPDNNDAYNEFIISQQHVLRTSFERINKKVHTNWTSIIGGRAKEVLNTEAVTALGKLVTIDHYVQDTSSMETYIQYFTDSMHAQTLIGEFGAPIPDINGAMSDTAQAKFIDSIFGILYTHKQNVLGVNYFALSNGTTEILDAKGNPKKAYSVLRKYFQPAEISGVVKNPLGDTVNNEPVVTVDGRNKTVTNNKGMFSLVVPAETATIIVGGKVYKPLSYKFNFSFGEKKMVLSELTPYKESFFYKVRLWVHNLIERYKRK